MSKKNNQPTFFAISRDGQLFVKLKAVIHPLIILCDGIPVVFFGGGKTAYLKLNTAIEWCKKEAQFGFDVEMYKEMIETMEKFKAQKGGVK
ncbi:MAG: hypothetical protein HZA50_11705 [Planctomycetes bacterium]|nr:hypothetical protein [Planctomycetota bacterium]